VTATSAVQISLPATSANLGSAFDVAAIALEAHLRVTAEPAAQFSIHATGRDAPACSRAENHLILSTYTRALRDAGLGVVPLALRIHNEIPLGMGCGSSAAARLAGLLLARSLGGLRWSDDQLLACATELEGHPDNVAACWHGGLAVSAVLRAPGKAAGPLPIATAVVPVPRSWSAAILLPRHPVLTEASRDVLPAGYDRAATVDSLQRCGLLIAAFATADRRLLRDAMDDRLHQPYRRGLCPLLEQAEGLYQVPGVLGVALSGAGPGLLLVLDGATARPSLAAHVQQLPGAAEMELLFFEFDRQGTRIDPLSRACGTGENRPSPGADR
jgi:homoserine kinase